MNDEQDALQESMRWDVPEAMSGPRVVVGLDDSAGARAALRFALEEADRRGVPVEAVMAFQPPSYWLDLNVVGLQGQEELARQVQRDHEHRARALVDEVAGGTTGPRPEVSVRVVAGAAADVLVRESHGADLLVVGSRGRGGFSSMLLGSTGIQCVLHATCPVTVVHSPEARRHRIRLDRERRAEPAPLG